MLVAHKLKYEQEQVPVVLTDTITRLDTIQVNPDSMYIQESIVEVVEKDGVETSYTWSDDVLEKYKSTAVPFIQAAQAAGISCYEVVGLTDAKMLEAFQEELGISMPFYMADDILLKTIVRSNPGFVLWKDGKIVHKWHIKKLPDFESVKNTYMQ